MYCKLYAKTVDMIVHFQKGNPVYVYQKKKLTQQEYKHDYYIYYVTDDQLIYD